MRASPLRLLASTGLAFSLAADAAIPEPAAQALLQLARAKPSDAIVAIGAGDAAGVLAAAMRLGVRRPRVAEGPEQADIPSADVVVVALEGEAALGLRPLLLVARPGTRVVALAPVMGDWQADRTVPVELPAAGGNPARKALGHLWIVPSNLNGDWCGQGAAGGAVLRISQRLQAVDGAFKKATKSLRFAGRIDGTRVAAAGGRLALEQSGDLLRVTAAQGNYAAFRGATFLRTCCGACPS
ncbi:MAG TPA: hypothetical protein PLE38_12425 [Usitatibacteraceae bacterium]|nr:hypothetical protein [Usitatibacteraceae bacterium]